MNIIKFAKILFVTTIISIFLTAGLLGGIQVEQNRLRQEEQLESVEDIAIVNLDEGIYKDAGKVNYAAELMEFPGENFVSTGLEEARNGIYNGSYAAYIIIPASFSANVESINSTPQKSIIEYAMNPNLKSQVSNRIVADVKNFESIISRNMSYMYVDAILQEFHGGQDSAKVIMKNDEKDLQALLSVDPSGLIELMEVAEVERAADEIEDIDLSDVYGDNEKMVGQINDNITESITKGQQEFEKVKSGQETVLQSAEGLIGQVNDIDLLRDESGNMIYDEGLRQIDSYITEYNKELDQNKNSMKTRLGGKGEGETEDLKNRAKVLTADTEPLLISDVIQLKVDFELNKIKEEISNRVKQFNEDLKSCKEELLKELLDVKTAVREASEKDTVSGNIPSVSGNVPGVSANVPTVSGNVPSVSANVPLMDYDAVLLRLDGISQQIEELPENNITADAAVIDMKAATDDIFKKIISDIDAAEKIEQSQIEKALQKYVVETIERKTEFEAGKILESAGKMSDDMMTYTQTLEEYDPFQYYEEGTVSEYLMKISDNMQMIESKVNEKNMDDRDYILDVYETAENNTMELEKNINEAYEGTADKIISTMDSVKKDRETLNEENKQLLNDFSKKLPYTRLGNVEYTQAYDLIVSPVSGEDKSIQKKKGITALYEYDNIRSIFIFLIALSVLEGLFLITNKLVLDNRKTGDKHMIPE